MRLLLPDESLRVAPQSGIGRYTAELIKGFAQYKEVEAIETFRRGSVEYVPIEKLMMSPASSSGKSFNRVFSRQRILENSQIAYRIYNGLTKAYYHRLLKPYADHLYHETNYILRPFDGISVTTIHDLSIFLYPEFHPKLRVRHMHENIQDTLERTNRIITDSDFIKKEITEMFGVDPNQIDVIRLGVDPSFRPRLEDEVCRTLKKFDLNYRQFFFVVGTIEPRKNLARTFRAYSQLPGYIQDKFPLVLTGQRGWDDGLLDQLDAQISRGRIRFLGYIPDSELKELYAAARAVLFLSLYEGFGFPVLESTASGTPILTSRDTAMEEIVGSGGGLVDPTDEGKISEELLSIASTPFNFSEKHVTDCHNSYNWQSTVQETYKSYSRAAENPLFLE